MSYEMAYLMICGYTLVASIFINHYGLGPGGLSKLEAIP